MERKILFVSDDNYVYPLVISIGAISLQKVGNIKIILVNIPNWTTHSPLIQDSNIRLIEDLCSKFNLGFQLVEIYLDDQEMVGTRSSYGHIPGTAWAKVVALFKLDLEQNSEVLYLDPDTLVLPGYEDIFSIQIESSVGIMARQTPGHAQFELKWAEEFTKLTAIQPPHESNWYFNSGVMKLQLSNLQRISHWVNWRDLLRNNESNQLALQDQDLLNAISIGRNDVLDPSFNCYPSEYSVEKTKILHFAGGYKPWQFRNPLSRLRINQNAKRAMKIWREKELEILKLVNKKCSLDDVGLLLQHKKIVDKGFSFALAKIFPTIANSAWVNILLNRNHGKT